MDEALLILPIAYTAGVLSMLAPCAFAMLPSYIAWYLNKEEGRESVPRALANGVLATAGGGAVMGTLAMLAVLGIRMLGGLVYFRIVIGVILVAMGAMMLAGRGMGIALPVTISRRRGPLAVFVFGALYSLASLGCVASVYLGMVLIAASQSVSVAALVVLVYVLGMGTTLIPITLAVSGSKTLLLKRISEFTPHMNTVSGIILTCMGLYMVIFGVWG
jgi:cytochrome c biogenesis protein CcdA